MNKLLISFIIAYVILTTAIVFVKPQMHKPLMFSPSKTVVENLPEKIADTQPQIIHVQQYEEEEDNIKFKPQKSEVSEQIIKYKEIPEQYAQNQKTAPIKNQTQTQQNIKIQDNSKSVPANKPKYELPQSVMDIVNNKSRQNTDTETIAEKPQTQVQQKNVNKPAPQPANVQQKPVQVQNNAPLTEEEELIIWNKWRSDLQNKVMRDSRIAAPRGTVFRFSFTVNKFGQISNLRVWSDTPSYTNYAIQALKPLLLSYQGQPILNFPSRTKRITTNVEGGFVVSNQDRYTTPNDYSDIERVRN